MLFILRMDARVGSAKDGFAEAYALTGPPNGGKSYVVLRLLRLLGEGPTYHCQPLPGVFFVNPPRQDPNASNPITAQLEGCRLCTPKEQPVRPLEPSAVKSILDNRDVSVAARHNHSQRGDCNNFEVTWTILIQSQGSIKLQEGESDVGVLDKIIELRPPFLLVPEESLDTNEPRHRVADVALSDLCQKGGLNGEVLFHMQLWYDLLSRDVCKHRCIMPSPPKSLSYREEANKDAGTSGLNIKDWMVRELVYCSEKDASPTKDIHAALKSAFGKVEPSTRTLAGIGPRTYQFRGGSKSQRHDYYKVLIPGKGTEQKPVRLNNPV